MVDTRESSGRPTTSDLELLHTQPTPNDIVAFRQRYRTSVDARDAYWRREAEALVWAKPFETVCDEDLASGKVSWFQEGTVDLCASLDRSLSRDETSRPALTVLPGDGAPVTVDAGELAADVGRVAAALVKRGLKPGDRLALWLADGRPLVTLLLAAARAGLTAVPLPCTFPARLVEACVADAGASLLIHDQDAFDGAKALQLGDDASFAALCAEGEGLDAPAGTVDAETPFLILYARAAGRPRGSVFPTAGFLVQAQATARLLWKGLDLEKKPAFVVDPCVGLCSEEGLSLGLWGALLGGQPLVVGPGVGPNVDCGGVWLATPGRIMEHTDAEERPVFDVIASSGDALSPRVVRAATRWTNGPERVLNLWSQTEAGGSLLFTRPAKNLNRPGALGLPLFGTEPAVINDFGEACGVNQSGRLVFRSSWPGMARTIYGQPERYHESYLAREPGAFSTQDGVRVDPEGFYWFMGRLDDVVKIDGASLATSEVEVVIASDRAVHEAAVVGVTGDTGLRLVAFVVPAPDATPDKEQLAALVEERLGEAARPAQIVVAKELPRTRTGKVVRRVLKRAAAEGADARDDVGHVANPECLDELFAGLGEKEGGQ